MTTKKLCFPLLALVFFSYHASALNIKPGLWQMDVTFTHSAFPMPPQSHQECIVADKVSVDDFMMDAVDCTFTDVKDTDTSMSWHADCRNEMGGIQGPWEIRIMDGDKGEGTADLRLSMAGFETPLKATWKTKYLGPCS